MSLFCLNLAPNLENKLQTEKCFDCVDTVLTMWTLREGTGLQYY